DASCGSTFATINITQPSAALSASCSLNSNVTCFGGNNGSATVNTSNAVGSLSYSWSPSGGSGSTAVGLTAGVYTVSVTDASCGSTFATINITQPSAPLSGFTFVINDANCLSTGDGRIGSNVNNAVGTVHYSWSPSGGTGSQATGLLAGTYTVTVSDDCSSFTSSQTINGPAVPMSVSCIPGSDVTCFGGNDGSASVNVFNSVGIVGYSWSPAGGSGPTATGLSAGTYTVTVSDYCATPTTCSVTITEPASALSVTCSAVNETSPGANNGSANVNPSGGSGGSLSYAWTPSGGSAATATGLAAGIYTVTVTDGSCGAMTCTSEVGTDCVSSTAATAASASTTEICSGNNVNLSLTGGSLGTGASWKWYEGGCGAGAVIGTGASITTGAITGAGIHTFYVRAEGDCGTTACVSVSITVTSGAPLGSIAVLSFPTVGCVGGSGSITCTSVAGATGYSWNGPAGILFNGNPGPYVSTSTTVALTYTALPPAGISGWNVCVFAKNACGNSANTKCSWIRSTLSSPNFSNASTIGCPSTTGIYTVATVDGAATYNWTITGGNASINGAGAVVTTTVPTVNIAFGAGFTGGTLCVSGTTACGYTGGTRCITITNAPLLPGAISGSTTLCPGSSSIFSIAPVDGAAAYIWTTTGTGVSVMGSGTSATVSTTGAFTSGSVCVVAVSTCGSPLGNSAQRCKTIGTGKLGTPGNISGDPTTGVCGQTYTYSIPSMAGATSGYTWTLPAGASGSSTTNSITLTFSGSFSSGILCVHGNNACGAGPDRCIMVYGNPGTPASLSGNTTPCAGGDEVYTWPAVPGASQYQVIVPVGYTVLSGTPTISNFAVINVTAASGQIGVKATNSCGVSGTRTLLLNPAGCRIAGNQPEVKAAMSAQVYPNPTSGDANIQFNSTLENDSYRISISDLSGRALLNLDGKAVQGINMQVIDVRKFSAGIYLLNLQTGEGNQLIRLIIE
ncbi:MAG TPA: T9SS type A sorting domain-containing protein, partial [Bacteroidia bacterium]|nr:T9SS type A sorting domain-containing protein [Bacteroidia bacterium]